jgi:hypothetical protein
MRWTRRELVAALSALAVPGAALGFGTTTKVDVAELLLGGGTLSRPNAWKRLLYEVIQTTSVECEPRAVQVGVQDIHTLFGHPFSVLIGDDGFDAIDDTTLEQLERYLSYGGFLLIDDATGTDKSPFDDAVRQLVRRLFPTRPLSPLPADHSVYRSFFFVERPMGRVDRNPVMEGITVGNLTPLIYMRNDLSGALDRRDNGQDAFSAIPGGSRQRREALKLGINLVMYALTANYKKDQAHVKQLMREGRLE